jgi:hypothetical protein
MALAAPAERHGGLPVRQGKLISEVVGDPKADFIWEFYDQRPVDPAADGGAPGNNPLLAPRRTAVRSHLAVISGGSVAGRPERMAGELIKTETIVNLELID